MNPRSSRGHRTAAVALVAALAMALAVFALTAVASGSDEATARASHAGATLSGADHQVGSDQSAETALYTAMRTQWGQHMEWTWATVVAFAEDSPALKPTINRLLQVAADQGKAIGTYYGKAAGKRATTLLTEHFTLAVPVLTAAKEGNQKALKKALKVWYANARQIADFIASANPNLPQKDLRQVMRGHITQTTAYAASVLGGRYTKAIRQYDHAEEHMMMLSDALSAGIITQFPEKFGRDPARRVRGAPEGRRGRGLGRPTGSTRPAGPPGRGESGWRH